MRIALACRPRQYHRIVERRMIQTIGEHVAGSSGENAHDSQDGQITGRKQQRPRQPCEPRERPFQVVVGTMMSVQQMGSAGPEPKLTFRLDRSLWRTWIPCEAEI